MFQVFLKIYFVPDAFYCVSNSQNQWRMQATQHSRRGHKTPWHRPSEDVLQGITAEKHRRSLARHHRIRKWFHLGNERDVSYFSFSGQKCRLTDYDMCMANLNIITHFDNQKTYCGKCNDDCTFIFMIAKFNFICSR